MICMQFKIEIEIVIEIFSKVPLYYYVCVFPKKNIEISVYMKYVWAKVVADIAKLNVNA